MHVGVRLRGEMSPYSPRFLERETLDDSNCDKTVMIFLTSKVNRGRTPMVMGTEKGKALCWVRVATRLLVGKVPLGWPRLSTGKKQQQSFCKALYSFHLVGGTASQSHNGSLERCWTAARGWGLGVSRFLIRDQIRWSTEEQGPRAHESWVPTPTWLLKLLCDLEQAPDSPGVGLPM